MTPWRIWLLFNLRLAEVRERYYLMRADCCAREQSLLKQKLALLDEGEA